MPRTPGTALEFGIDDSPTVEYPESLTATTSNPSNRYVESHRPHRIRQQSETAVRRICATGKRTTAQEPPRLTLSATQTTPDDTSKTPDQTPTWVRFTVRSRVPVRSSRRPPRYDRTPSLERSSSRKRSRHPTDNNTTSPLDATHHHPIPAPPINPGHRQLTRHCAPTGREAGEEEGPQGPREEARHLHPPLRKRRHDRRQAQDEPQPHLLNSPTNTPPIRDEQAGLMKRWEGGES
jgi:hypothetical protein